MSNAQVAQYLKHLAAQFEADRKYPQVVDGLLRAASKMEVSSRRSPSRAANSTPANQIVGALEESSLEKIAEIIQSDKLTKQDLIDLAVRRFSIPGGRLRKMQSNEVKQVMLSTISHEKTLDTILSEASRYGFKRKS